MIAAPSIEAPDPAQAIDVAGDEMSVQSAVRGQGAFQVDAGTAARELEVGSSPGLAKEIEMEEPGPAGRTERTDLNDGQAAAVHRHAVARLERAGATRRGEYHPDRAGGGFDGVDGAGFFHD